MKSVVLAVLMGLGLVGCGSEAPMSSEDIAALDVEESEYESVEQELTVATLDPVTVASVQVVDIGPVSLDPGYGGEFDTGKGKNKCTDEKQMACDSCISACDGLCALPGGGGRAGSCVGLFCPTRCDVCQLSCFTACGKCTPTIYK